MSSTMMDRAQHFADEHARGRRWRLAAVILACVAIVAAVWAFVLPGRALEGQPTCGIEEHQHSEACFARELSCGLEESEGHVHGEECYAITEVLSCDQEESEGHVHGDECMVPGDPVLVCELEESEEHVHGDECYMPGESYIGCGLEEAEGHVHGDGCYASVEEVICGQEEREAHVHEESCYGEALTCTLPEHAHDAACYEPVPALSDPNADRETPEQWEQVFDSLQLTGDWAADLAAVANTQLGYRESKLNYQTDHEGVQRGYTRYGQWYGMFDADLYADRPEEAHFNLDPDACIYMDWDALFVSFCLNYAGISHEAMPYATDAAQWAELLWGEAWNRYASADGEYVPVAGDLVFFDNNRDGVIDHVGIVTRVDEYVHEPEGEPVEGEEPIEPVVDRTLTVVCLSQTPSEREVAETQMLQPEADVEVTRLVKAETLDLTDPDVTSRIAGYGMLPQNPEQVVEPEGPADAAGEENPEGPDPNADIETPEDWEATLEGVNLTGDVRSDVVAVAQSQLGYTESSLNYIENEDGESRNGYTRYGQWYGDPYGDWCAMFASFCLAYGGAQDYPLDASCPNWVSTLQENGQYQEAAGDYIPQPGDLVFYDVDQDGIADHMGIVGDISTIAEPLSAENPEGSDAGIEVQADFLADEAAPLSDEWGTDEPMTSDEGTASDDAPESGEAPEPDAEPTEETPADSEPESAQAIRLVSIVAIEGNAADAVSSVAHDSADPTIMGYGSLVEKSGFTINGRDVPSTYTWDYADGLMSMIVTLEGDAVVDGGYQRANLDPVLDVAVGSPEDAKAIVEKAMGNGGSGGDNPDPDWPWWPWGSYGTHSDGADGDLSADTMVLAEGAVVDGAVEGMPVVMDETTESAGDGADGSTDDAVEAEGADDSANTDDDNPVQPAEVPDTTLAAAPQPTDGAEGPLTEGDVEEVHPLMTFDLQLMVGTEEVDLSQCVAKVELKVSREVLALPTTVDEDGNEVEQVLNSFKLYSEEGELGTATLDENSDYAIVTYSDDAQHVVAGAATTTSNPAFTIQHYFHFPQVVTGSGKITIPFINASSSDPNVTKEENIGKGGNLPTNGSTPNTFTVPIVDKDGTGQYRFDTKLVLTKLFLDEPSTYRERPQINYMCRLYNDDSNYNDNYDLEEVWVYQPAAGTTPKNPDDLKESDFFKYKLAAGEDGWHNPSQVRFTNNPSSQRISAIGADGNAIASTPTDAYPFTYTILIQQGTVVRFVFDTTTDRNTSRNANFFDYDITSGVIYNTADVTGAGLPTSQQTDSATWYANTNQQGINSPENYGAGTKYAFGNRNTGTTLGEVAWGGQQLNKYNNNSYLGCTFGLVSGLTYGTGTHGLPIPTWSDGVAAPDIFSSADVRGKTVYANGQYQLNFLRDGGTYTLASVVGSPSPYMIDLTTLIKTYDNGTKQIYSNEFWPLTKSPSDGTDGHDLRFGNDSLKNLRQHSGTKKADNTWDAGSFPTVDAANQNRDHDQDSYFGMSFTVDFTVRPGYCSPLAYWFYGDDDMWVFLDEIDENGNSKGNARLVADIGGVHSSVGEYVNLWDYIDQIPYKDENGNENASKTYRLTIFYTERGASGSTCYMRFTVPLVAITDSPSDRTEAVVFEKVLLDENGNVRPYDPTDETLFDFELTLTNSAGTSYEDAYDYAVYRTDTTPDHTVGTPVEQGVITTPGANGKYQFRLHGGEYIVISNLPDNTHYTIEEIAKPGYVTYFQKGNHRHVNGQQVDSLESAVSYGHIAGNIPRIDAAVNNMVRFTNGPAVKTEVTPGDGQTVVVGDEIIYEIEWGNDQGGEAEVVITDVLDEGVDFVAAAFGTSADADQSTESSTWWNWDGVTNEFTSNYGNKIAYDPATRTVTWTRFAQSAQASGVVALKVRVNENALKDEGIVDNQATITVGNQSHVTNRVENPTWKPVKTEVTPGPDQLVRVGDKVTYQITWKNYTFEEAGVVVRDPLDRGVTFDPAVNKATAYIKTGVDSEGKPVYEKMDVTAAYASPITDPTYPETQFSGQLTWDLGTQPSGAEGYVEFDVTVNENAIAVDNTAVGEIWNWGYVTVGNRPEVETNHIWNPVPTYELPETGGSGDLVYLVGAAFLGAGVGLAVKRRTDRRRGLTQKV